MRILLLIFLFAALAGQAFSQVGSTLNYTFTPTTNGSLTDMTSGSTSLLYIKTATGNFGSGAYPIGFDFWLMGTRYNYFSVNSNGLLRLGKKAVRRDATNSQANAKANTPSLYPFWDDLNSVTLSAKSKIRSKVTGTAPFRVLTIEWKDFVIRASSTNGVQTSTWQARLYETTGVFEYVYGRMQTATGSAAVKASIGMTIADTANRQIYIQSLTPPTEARTNNIQVLLVNSNVAGPITSLNSAANGSRVNFEFKPVTCVAPTNLIINGITTSSMTLNWTASSPITKVFGYVIYRSDDGGVNYKYVAQVPVGTNASVQGALSPNTTYYWKVYAVTEGYLAGPITANATTTSCVGLPATNTMTIINGSPATILWSDGTKWSLGHPPTACENAVITYTQSGGNTKIVTMDISATVNNLTINGVYSSNGTKKLFVNMGGYFTGTSLTVLGNLSMSATGGNSESPIASLVSLLAFTGSTVTVKGNCTIGQASDQRISIFGAKCGQDPEIYLGGNITYNTYGTSTDDNTTGSGAALGGSGLYYFDGGPTQTLTNNTNRNVGLTKNYGVFLGDVEIGKKIPTTLTVNGTYGYKTYVDSGNMTINSGSSLILAYNAAFNQNQADYGGLILKGNSYLKLGDYANGPTGSNFPADFQDVSIDTASTVEYNYDISNGPNDQVIWTDYEYGNLVLSNNSRKTINDILIINGNFSNNATSTFDCKQATNFLGTTFTNNGAIEGNYANSKINFYDTLPQFYAGNGAFGTAATPFGGLGVEVFNPTQLTLNSTTQIYTDSLMLTSGAVINGNRFTIGAPTRPGLLQRGGNIDYIAGSVDAHPAIGNTGDYTIRYEDAAAQITTGPEIPASTVARRVYSNNINGVLQASDLSVSEDMQLLQNIFDMGANTLQIGNTIIRTNGILNGTNGTLEMKGSTAQTIADSTLINDNLKNLIVNNSDPVGVTLGDTLNILRSVTFGSQGTNLKTNDRLVFRSTNTETAWLGNMTGKTIDGNATVERYIPNHSKAWQFLAVPSTGQTINAAWQEGNVPLGNTKPGYGTIITNNIAGAGFDIVAGFPSMKYYDTASNTWTGVINTGLPVANPKGYMIFVRGDRSVTATNAAATATILRTKGTLFTPANAPADVNLAANTFQSVGNPYPSAIDLSNLSKSGGVQDIFYVWDPKITAGIGNGYGAYQTLSWNTDDLDYDVTPGEGSYPTGKTKTIESGQAFFVHSLSIPGTLAFGEGCKAAGSNLVTKSMSAPLAKQLRTNLRAIVADKKILLDGNRVQFDRAYNPAIDMADAIKLVNSGENIGLARDGKHLSVERRPLVTVTDTLFYKLGQLRVQQYELEFIPSRMDQPGMTAWLEDKYLNTSTVISLQDTSRVLFNVINVPGSYASDRFRLVFKRPRQAANITPTLIEGQGKAAAKGVKPAEAIETAVAGISVYPNPVTGELLRLHFTAQEAGSYQATLFNKLGQPVYQGALQTRNANEVKTIRIPKLAAGNYQLTIRAGSGETNSLQVMIP